MPNLDPASVVQIVQNGGGVKVRSNDHLVENLATFAANAKNTSARIEIIVGANLTLQNLVQIAKNGGGNVLFDLTEG